jgi:hypothetical protein
MKIHDNSKSHYAEDISYNHHQRAISNLAIFLILKKDKKNIWQQQASGYVGNPCRLGLSIYPLAVKTKLSQDRYSRSVVNAPYRCPHGGNIGSKEIISSHNQSYLNKLHHKGNHRRFPRASDPLPVKSIMINFLPASPAYSLNQKSLP